jgi:hypothetical protein
MVFWSDFNKDTIETTALAKDRSRFRCPGGGPVRFQIPRGLCRWGVSAYKSLNVDVEDPSFIAWWRDLESRLCPFEPFNSNLKDGSIRLKIDDSAYIFDQNSKQILPEMKEGLFRGQEISCMIDVDSTYFFNGNWGLTIRVYQIKTLTDSVEHSEPDAPIVAKGTCAFLPETDA